MNKHTGLSVSIDDNLIDQISATARLHYPKEFGGILVGRYSEDKKTVIVTDTILPEEFESSSFTFQRGVKGLRKSLSLYYDQSPSLQYVGEWHTHPDGPTEPSKTDIRALEEIVQHKEVYIDNPILMIMSISKRKKNVGLFVYYKAKIYQYDEI